jgi:hypothetical protein
VEEKRIQKVAQKREGGSYGERKNDEEFVDQKRKENIVSWVGD